jgi:hypothetical protein
MYKRCKCIISLENTLIQKRKEPIVTINLNMDNSIINANNNILTTDTK